MLKTSHITSCYIIFLIALCEVCLQPLNKMQSQNVILNYFLNFNLIINLNTNKKDHLSTNPRIKKIINHVACKAGLSSRSHVDEGDDFWGSTKVGCSFNASSACFGCTEDDSLLISSTSSSVDSL